MMYAFINWNMTLLIPKKGLLKQLPFKNKGEKG